MRKTALIPCIAYGFSLTALGAAVLSGAGFYEGAFHYTLQALPFVIGTIWAVLWASLKVTSHRAVKDKIFLAGCGLLVLLLPFGDLFIYLAAPLLLFHLISNYRHIMKIFRFPAKPLAQIWLILLAIGCITAFFARSPASAFAMTAALASYALIFALGAGLEMSAEEQRFLSDFFIGLISLSVLFMLFHLKVGKSIVLFGILFSADAFTASFFSDWSANAAGFLCLAFTLIFGRLLSAVKNGEFLPITLISTALIIVFIGILATQTRMVFLFFVGFGALFLIFYPWKFLRKTRFLIILLPFVLLPILAQYSEKWKATLASPLEQTSFVDRFSQINYGITLLKEGRFFQGTGLFNFRLYYNEMLSTQKLNLPTVDFLHNIYFSMLSETGIFGFLVFLAAIISLFRHYYRCRTQCLPYLGMLLLGGLLFYNITDNWLYVLKFSLLSFFLLGVFYPKTDLN